MGSQLGLYLKLTLLSCFRGFGGPGVTKTSHSDPAEHLSLIVTHRVSSLLAGSLPRAHVQSTGHSLTSSRPLRPRCLWGQSLLPRTPQPAFCQRRFEAQGQSLVHPPCESRDLTKPPGGLLVVSPQLRAGGQLFTQDRFLPRHLLSLPTVTPALFHPGGRCPGEGPQRGAGHLLAERYSSRRH